MLDQPITTMTQREADWHLREILSLVFLPTNNKSPPLREHTNYSAVGFSLAGVFQVSFMSCWCVWVLKLQWLQCSRGDLKAKHVWQRVRKKCLWAGMTSKERETLHKQKESMENKGVEMSRWRKWQMISVIQTDVGISTSFHSKNHFKQRSRHQRSGATFFQWCSK